MSKGRYLYNSIWLENPNYKAWLQYNTDTGKCYCSLCHKALDIASNGESALKSHAKGKKHKELEASSDFSAVLPSTTSNSLENVNILNDKVSVPSDNSLLIENVHLKSYSEEYKAAITETNLFLEMSGGTMEGKRPHDCEDGSGESKKLRGTEAAKTLYSDLSALLNDSDAEFPSDSDGEEMNCEEADIDADVDVDGAVFYYGGNGSAPTASIAYEMKKGRRPGWRIGQMPERGPSSEDELISEVDISQTPLEAFFTYFDTTFWLSLARQTNLNLARKQIISKTNATEIINFTGIQILMGCLKYPKTRLYWSRDLAIPLITNCMTRSRYFELRTYLHFSDTPSPTDKLWKVRPIVDAVLRKCRTFRRSKHLAVSQEMIPFAGKCNLRQYVPSNKDPLGLKNFVLIARDGLILDFQIYVGKGTVSEEEMQKFGHETSIVRLLCRSLPKDGSRVVYTGKLFSSVDLAENLLLDNIYFTGDIDRSRIYEVNGTLKGDKELLYGQWDERVREDDQLSILKWKDSKATLFMSSCYSGASTATASRYSKEQKKKVGVKQPNIYRAYSIANSGVDASQRYLAQNRSCARTNKWPVRLFCHFVDLAIVNAWLMYKRCHSANRTLAKDVLTLLEYRMQVATTLIRYNHEIQGDVKQDEPTESECCPSDFVETSLLTRKNRRPIAPPSAAVRYEEPGHLPKLMDDKNASKCRMDGCKSRSRIMCVKCHMYLCVFKHNCFELFHTKPSERSKH